MLAEFCAPVPFLVRAPDSQNYFCLRCPSSSHPQSSWESLGFSSILLQKNFQMRKKMNKAYQHLTVLVLWPSGFAVAPVLWFPEPLGAAAAGQWVLVLTCLQQHPVQGHR